MKQFIAAGLLLFGAPALKAQDVISLKSGEAINGKVAEVGINEIRYYKASNLQGPVYVLSKADVAQIAYQNKTVDVFNNTTATVQNSTTANPPVVVVTQPQTERVIVQRPVYRRSYWPVVIDAHIPLFSHHGGDHHYNTHGSHH